MARSLFLLGLVLCLTTSVFAVTLENLCPNAKFTYKNKFEVNSVHRIKMNRTLSKVGAFMIDEDLDFTSYFASNADAELMETLREKYNQFIVEVIYTEDTLNNPTQLRVIHQYLNNLEAYKNQTEQLKEKALRQYLGRFNEMININLKAQQLVKMIMLFRDGQLKPEMLSMDGLRSMINNLDIDKTKATFAFQNDLISTIYKRPIEKFERFFFVRKSDKFYDFDSFGTIEYSFLFPFKNEDYTLTNCLNSNELPPFYANKTRQ